MRCFPVCFHWLRYCVCVLIGLQGEGEQVNEDVNVRVNIKDVNVSLETSCRELFVPRGLRNVPCPDFTLLISTPNKPHLTLTEVTVVPYTIVHTTLCDMNTDNTQNTYYIL